MIFQINNDELMISSEDLMEAKYLESLFTFPMHVEMETDLVRRGFNVTNEQCTCVKLIKGDVP